MTGFSIGAAIGMMIAFKLVDIFYKDALLRKRVSNAIKGFHHENRTRIPLYPSRSRRFPVRFQTNTIWFSAGF
jgi:hypothetical protein